VINCRTHWFVPVRHAILLTILFATATVFGHGLLANFGDLLFGF
jgi:hypothetical protein